MCSDAVSSSQVAPSPLCWSEREVSLLHPMAAGHNNKTLADVGMSCKMVASAVQCMLYAMLMVPGIAVVCCVAILAEGTAANAVPLGMWHGVQIDGDSPVYSICMKYGSFKHDGRGVG